MDCELLKYLLAYFGCVGTIIMWYVTLTHPIDDTAAIAFIVTMMAFAVAVASFMDCEMLQMIPLYIFRDAYI